MPPGRFMYCNEFRAYVKSHGVPRAASNYITWMNRTSDHLGRQVGPRDLSSRENAEQLVEELAGQLQANGIALGAKDRTNYLSTFRKYAQMVQSNYRGLFLNISSDPVPAANDASADGVPERVQYIAHRIVRDTEKSRQIKRLYEHRCQVCGKRLEVAPGEFYAEAHHLQPLGAGHKGPDVQENLVCLCPNHHAMFDYFALPLKLTQLKMSLHKLGKEYVDYHNKRVTVGR